MTWLPELWQAHAPALAEACAARRCHSLARACALTGIVRASSLYSGACPAPTLLGTRQPAAPPVTDAAPLHHTPAQTCSSAPQNAPQRSRPVSSTCACSCTPWSTPTNAPRPLFLAACSLHCSLACSLARSFARPIRRLARARARDRARWPSDMPAPPTSLVPISEVQVNQKSYAVRTRVGMGRAAGQLPAPAVGAGARQLPSARPHRGASNPPSHLRSAPLRKPDVRPRPSDRAHTERAVIRNHNKRKDPSFSHAHAARAIAPWT